MNALDYALLVLGILVIYLIFFRKKKKEEIIIEEKPIPLLEEEPMNEKNFVRPILVEESKVERKIIPIKKVEKIKPVERTVNTSQSKKKVIVKSSNKEKKRVYNEESSRISEDRFKTPYRNEDTLNHIAPVLPVYENEPAVPLYEPSISIETASSSPVETSSNETSFNNNNDGFGGGGAVGEY